MGKPRDNRNHGVLKKWKETLSSWCVWQKGEISGRLSSEREARSFMVLEIVFKDFVLHSKITGGSEIFYIKMLVNNRMTRDCVQPGGGR